jgi:hypothetical protein
VATALSITAAKRSLNVTRNDSDDELLDTIRAAEAVLAHRVGPLAPTTYTERLAGNSDVLALTFTPVLSLTSVTPRYSTALTVADLDVDAESGLITYPAGTVFGTRQYDVVYVAGRAEGECPADLLQASIELTRHMWQTQRGPGAVRPGAGVAEQPANTLAGAQYLLPFRVEQIIAPHERLAIG